MRYGSDSKIWGGALLSGLQCRKGGGCCVPRLVWKNHVLVLRDKRRLESSTPTKIDGEVVTNVTDLPITIFFDTLFTKSARKLPD